MAKRKTTKKATQNNKLNTQSWWADGDLDPRLPNIEGNAGKVPVVAENEKGFEYGNISTAFTHSFDELDPEIKAICESAINSEGAGVLCTEETWNDIKSLLDKSLYFEYEHNVLIKIYEYHSVDTTQYKFGILGDAFGLSLEFNYNSDESWLKINLSEV